MRSNFDEALGDFAVSIRNQRKHVQPIEHIDTRQKKVLGSPISSLSCVCPTVIFPPINIAVGVLHLLTAVSGAAPKWLTNVH